MAAKRICDVCKLKSILAQGMLGRCNRCADEAGFRILSHVTGGDMIPVVRAVRFWSKNGNTAWIWSYNCFEAGVSKYA
jgi:hypothetical protein